MFVPKTQSDEPALRSLFGKAKETERQIVFEQSLWESRFSSIQVVIEQLNAALAPKGGLNFLGKNVMEQVVAGLLKFAEGQWSYLSNYSNYAPSRQTKSINDHSQEVALRITLNKLSEDLEVFERVISQRRSLGDQKDKSIVAERLLLADQLAYEALKPMLKRVLPEKASVITYFQRNAEVRVLPYVDAAIIGIPYSAINEPRDLFAIPHEVGHYVYWNALYRPQNSPLNSLPSYVEAGETNQLRIADVWKDILRKERKEYTEDKEKYALNWAEEAFADCYATWVAGPFMAKDAGDYELEYATKQLLEDDGDHPLAAIRPQSHFDVLNAFGYPEWSVMLSGEWAQAMKELSIDLIAQKFARAGAATKSVPLPEASDHLRKMTQTTIGWLQQLTERQATTSTNFWHGHVPGTDKSSDQLYGVMNEALKTPPNGYIDNCESCRDWDEFAGDLKMRERQRARLLGLPANETKPDWDVILEAGGWATGPNGGGKRGR